MKPPRGLKITDHVIGTGRPCVPGDIAVCQCTCVRRRGEPVFSSESGAPFLIRVGSPDSFVGVEYGLLGMQIGGQRRVVVPPNLNYREVQIFTALPSSALLVYELKLLDLPEKWDPDMEQRLADR